MTSFIDEHRGEYGVEPICRVLPIAPSTYHERVASRRDPSRLSPRVQRDQAMKPEVRREFRDAEGQPLDGLLYRSSRPGAGTACVLFAENDQCAEADFKGKPLKHLLWLRAVKHENCPPCRRKGSC